MMVAESALKPYDALTSRNDSLAKEVQDMLNSRPEIEWHDWLHFRFVARKAIEFARGEGCDSYLTAAIESAALVHDVNYLVEVNTGPEAGMELRQGLLRDHGFEVVECKNIERWVMEAHTATRGADISLPAQMLSDADTVYKAVPFRPLDMAKFIRENGINPLQWAKKVTGEQRRLMDEGIYFYTATARKKYLKGAEANLFFVEYMQFLMAEDPETWNLMVELGEQHELLVSMPDTIDKQGPPLVKWVPRTT